MKKTRFILHDVNYKIKHKKCSVDSVSIGYNDRVETFMVDTDPNVDLNIGETYEAYLKGFILRFAEKPVNEKKDYIDVIDAEIVKVEEDGDDFIYLMVDSAKGPMILSYNKKRLGASQLIPGLTIRVEIAQFINFSDDCTEGFQNIY